MSGRDFPSNNFRVFLELARRNDGYNLGQQNRIPLFADNISIGTTKTVLNVGIPFSGAITGESQRVAFDMDKRACAVAIRTSNKRKNFRILHEKKTRERSFGCQWDLV